MNYENISTKHYPQEPQTQIHILLLSYQTLAPQVGLYLSCTSNVLKGCVSEAHPSPSERVAQPFYLRCGA